MVCGGHEDGVLPPPNGTAARHADFRAAPPHGAHGVHPLFASLVMGVSHVRTPRAPPNTSRAGAALLGAAVTAV
eukprot:4173266-Prymnesium_polylepis.1